MALQRDLIYSISLRGLSETVRSLDGLTNRIKALAEQEDAFARHAESAARKAAESKKRANKTTVDDAQATARKVVEAETKASNDSIKAEEKTANARRNVRKRANDSIASDLNDFSRRVFQIQQDELNKTKDWGKARVEIAKRIQEEMNNTEMQGIVARKAMQLQAYYDARRMLGEQAARDRSFDHKRLMGGLAHGMVEGIHGAVSGVKGLVTGGLRTLSRGMGLNDSLDVSSVMQEQARVGKLLDITMVEARTTGSTISNGAVRNAKGELVFDRHRTAADIANASNQYGIRQDVLAAAVEEGSRLGSGADIANAMPDVARQVKNYGGDEEAAKTVAKLRTVLKTSGDAMGRPLSEEAVTAFVDKFALAGKKGNMRGADMGKFAERFVSSIIARGGNLAEEADKYIQWTQLTNATTGSPAMTATAMSGVGDQIAKKSDKIHGLGIKTKVKDKDGVETDRSELEVAMDVIEKTKGNDVLYNKIFDPSRSGKALTVLKKTYDEAESRQKGSGRDAMNAKLNEYRVSDQTARAELTQDIADEQKTASGQIEAASVRVRNALANELAPVMAELAKDAPTYAKVIAETIRALAPALKDSLLPALQHLAKEAPNIARGLQTMMKMAAPVLQWFTSLATDHPGLAAGMVMGGAGLAGAIGGGGKIMTASILEWLGRGMVNTLPTVAGKAPTVAAGALGTLGGMVSQMASTPVYVTGVAPGVALGGGGIPGVGAPVQDAAKEVVKGAGETAVGGATKGLLGMGAGTAFASAPLLSSLAVTGAGAAGFGLGWLLAPGMLNKTIDRITGYDQSFVDGDESKRNALERARSNDRYQKMGSVQKFAYNFGSILTAPIDMISDGVDTIRDGKPREGKASTFDWLLDVTQGTGPEKIEAKKSNFSRFAEERGRSGPTEEQRVAGIEAARKEHQEMALANERAAKAARELESQMMRASSAVDAFASKVGGINVPALHTPSL